MSWGAWSPMWTGRALGGAVVLGLLLLAGVPGGLAQGSPFAGSEDERSHGYLYLDGEVQRQRHRITPIDLGCEQVPESGWPVYAITSHVPRTAQADRVQASPSYGQIGCSTDFEMQVPEPFTFRSGTTVTFWTTCDTVPVAPLPNNQGLTVRVFKNGEEIARADESTPFEPNLCMDDPRQWNVTLNTGGVEFEEGDQLGVWIWLFRVDPTQSIRFVVDSTDYPSSIHGPGIPGELRASLDAPITANVSHGQAVTAAGNVTTYPVELSNVGGEDRSVQVAIDGPDRWAANASVDQVTVPANGTARLNVTVGAPANATVGSAARHGVSLASDGGTITFQTTTHVDEEGGYFDPGLAEELGVQSTEPEDGGLLGVPAGGSLGLLALGLAAFAGFRRARR